MYADEEYSDSQRLDEMQTADDYNRFEEAQIAMDDEGSDWEREAEADAEGWVAET